MALSWMSGLKNLPLVRKLALPGPTRSIPPLALKASGSRNADFQKRKIFTCHSLRQMTA
jgi:hypothetical protein